MIYIRVEKHQQLIMLPSTACTFCSLVPKPSAHGDPYPMKNTFVGRRGRPGNEAILFAGVSVLLIVMHTSQCIYGSFSTVVVTILCIIIVSAGMSLSQFCISCIGV